MNKTCAANVCSQSVQTLSKAALSIAARAQNRDLMSLTYKQYQTGKELPQVNMAIGDISLVQKVP